MLVLSRRLYEKIVFPEIQATIQVVTIKPGVVRLAIDAPRGVSVFREEIAPRTPAAENPPTSLRTLNQETGAAA